MADIESRVREALTALGMDFELMPCDPDFADTAAFCEKYGVDPWDSANTILVSSRRPAGKSCACIVLAPTRLDVNHKVCELLDVRKASFASGEDTMAKTGMMIGGVTPFALPPDLPIYIDARVMEREFVVAGGGSRSVKVRVQPAAFARLPGATVVEALALSNNM